MNDETQPALPRPAPGTTDPAGPAAETAADDSAPAPHAETLAQTPDQAARAIGAPGRVFVPGYEVLGELGRGGMGEIGRAHV